MLDAIVGVKRPRGFHSLSGAAAPRLEGLFFGALRNAHVLNDRRQDVLGVVAQFCLGHLWAWWHQRLGESGKFADDFVVVAAYETAQGHDVLRAFPWAWVTGASDAEATLAIEPGRCKIAELRRSLTGDKCVGAFAYGPVEAVVYSPLIGPRRTWSAFAMLVFSLCAAPAL